MTPEGRWTTCPSVTVLNRMKIRKGGRRSFRRVEGKSKNHKRWKVQGEVKALVWFVGFNLGECSGRNSRLDAQWMWPSVTLNSGASAFPRGLPWGSGEEIYVRAFCKPWKVTPVGCLVSLDGCWGSSIKCIRHLQQAMPVMDSGE